MFWQERVSVSTRRQLLIYAALPIAYLISGRLGLFLAVPPGYATAVFLPAGIAVAAMFMAGAATLPGTFVGSLLLNIWIGYSIANQVDLTSIAAALVIALASMLQAGVGGTALRRLLGYPAPLDGPRDILVFLLLSPLFCLTSATLSLSGMWALSVVQPADLIINWMTWWVGDTLGVLVALPLMLVLAGEPRALWRSRARLVAVPMLLCFALFVGIFVRVTKWENEESLLEFRMQSQRVADLMRASLDEQGLFLGQLSRVFDSGAALLSRQNFHGLAQELLRRFPTIQSVEWAPRVLIAERAAFETAQQADLPGFAIRERNSSGQLVLASDRSQFYPVTYIEPLIGNEAAVGFDLTSTAERQAAIGRAIKSGTVAATAPIRLVQERGEQAGMLLTQSVPKGPNGAGIVMIVLRMGTFISTLADPLASTLQLRLLDTATAQRLFDDFPPQTSALYETGFDFGMRRYIVQTAPSAIYLARHRGWQSWAVLAAGVLSTGLLGALLMLGTGHRAREAELEIITTRTPFMLIRCSPDLHYRFVSEAYAQMLGRRPEDIVGKPMVEIIGEEGLRTVLPHIKKVLQGERTEYESEVHYQGVGKRFLHGVYTPDKDKRGNVNGWIASIVDITERKRAEAQRDLLIAELSHRVKNTLATVISIAHQSFAKGRSADEARRSFDDRIRALAQSHARLAEANWSGVSLEAIVTDEIAPYRDGGTNVRIGGPDITLSPKSTVSIGMAIHELTTNAAKHGALSTKGGSLAVTWQVTPENEVRISWVESDAPPVSPPQHSGFGRLLLEQALVSDLGGDVKLDFTKSGLQCLIAFPLSRSAQPVKDGTQNLERRLIEGVALAPDSNSSINGDSLRGARVLIVEDEFLLALELEQLLLALGCRVIGPFSDLTRAMQAAQQEPIDVAVLDTNLNDEMVYPLADDLSARQIPFMFATGYGKSNLPERFQRAPRVSKPYDSAALTKELQRTRVQGLSAAML